MNAVFLSGNSMHNRAWIHEAFDRLSDLFDHTYVQDYAHWSNGNEYIDIDHEIAELAKHSELVEQPYIVFCKSIGSVLAIQTITNGALKPAAVLVCGLPLSYILTSFPEFREKLAELNMPVTIIQNDQDPVGGFASVQTYLSALTNTDLSIVETKANTHDYSDYALLRALLSGLISAA